jgi:hypothetical protein
VPLVLLGILVLIVVCALFVGVLRGRGFSVRGPAKRRRGSSLYSSFGASHHDNVSSPRSHDDNYELNRLSWSSA